MLTRIIGDIHGNWNDYQIITENIKHNSIQVGDFGIGFSGTYWHDRVNNFHSSGQHRFIRGNHDNPSKCKQDMVGYIPDGTIENDVMYVGGAWSIDRGIRKENVNWWADEELSYTELDKIIEIYSIMKPRVMITHDCPLSVSNEMFVKKGKTFSGRQYATRTGQALQVMFEIHQPELHFFGHWHDTQIMKMEGTTFQCIGISDFVDVEI